MSSARIGEGFKGPNVALADNVFSARRDVREAEEELKARPSYMAALKVQILKRHWDKLRVPKPVPVIEREWDDEALRPVDTVYVGDPGDER